ncbi:helix-hairpin-helix domain-containing protein, partial [Streptococcus suis]|uniref:helix-hairpin-helix domain-containing protein n=1 Tax=Streptococcus suis TaxID=1307 RepID=UPI001EE6CEC0
NVSVVAFHYRSYGTFCIYSKRLHNLYSGFTHYRYYRAKNSFSSKLDGIEGLGPKRKQALMKHFKSIGNIQSASLQEIAEAGVPYKVAEKVKEKLK